MISIGSAADKLDNVARALKTRRRIFANIKAKVAQEIVLILDDEFARTQDPWGQKWAPKKRPNGQPTLVASGKMKSSFVVRVVPTGVRVTNAVAYSGFHQSGTERMPARKMVPESGRLPRLWGPRIRRVVKVRFFRDMQGLLR